MVQNLLNLIRKEKEINMAKKKVKAKKAKKGKKKLNVRTINFILEGISDKVNDIKDDNSWAYDEGFSDGLKYAEMEDINNQTKRKGD